VCLGDVAQLGERLVRNEEAVGSTPIISTRYHSSLQICGIWANSRVHGKPLYFTVPYRRFEIYEADLPADRQAVLNQSAGRVLFKIILLLPLDFSKM
jgi:hypothetical protein